MSKRICLGKIATAHGVRGLVKVFCYAEDPNLLNGPLFTAPEGEDSLTLTMKNSMGKYRLAEIGGVNDRDAALALRGTELWGERDRLPALESDNEFYIEDLVGLRTEDAEGKNAGEVIAVHNYGAGDLLEIRPPQGESYFLLFNDANVQEVLTESGKIIIAPSSVTDV